MARNFFLQSSGERHFGWLPIFAVVKWAAVNMTLPYADFLSLAYIPRGGTAGLSIFRFLRFLILSPTVAIPVYIPTNSGAGRLSPPDILKAVVVLLCISLMASDPEHFCMCLLAIWISFLEPCLRKSLARFLSGWFVLLLLSFLKTSGSESFTSCILCR